jgi:predicted nucleotidyltransferase
MNLEELRQYKPQIMALAEQYGVTNIRVFDSVARGDADADSGVDFLVHWNRPSFDNYYGAVVD